MRPVILAAACIAFACTKTEPPKNLTRTEFRDAFVAALKAKSPHISATTAGELSIKAQIDGRETILNLDSGYAEYLATPDQRSQIIEKWAAVATTSPDNDIRATLVYVLRHHDYLAPPNLPKADLVTQPFGGDLVKVLMVDSQQSMRAVTTQELPRAGLTTDQAWRLADANFRKRLGPVSEVELDGDGPTVHFSDTGLATGILALPDACQPAGGFLADGRIVLVLDRDGWITTLPNDPVSEQRFWAFVKPRVGKGQLLSDTPLTCKAGKWEVVKPPS